MKAYKIIGVSSALIVIAFLLLAIYPPQRIGQAEFVMFASATPTENTKISYIYMENPEYVALATFTDNTDTEMVDIGETIHRLYVYVYIAKTYASTVQQAMNYTRVYVEIEDPTTEVRFSDYLDTHEGLVTSHDNYYEVSYWVGSLGLEVIEGTWTITTQYDVYI